MRRFLHLIHFLTLIILFNSCKKEKANTECFPNATTVRQISNKQAVIKLTGTVNDVWIIEEGSIDTKLIPCNFPMEFYQDGLKVIISGDVKSTPQAGPCCSENFFITKITR